jgi:hypothetical protein
MNSHRDVLARLAEWALQSSIETLQHEDRLTQAMREALRNGMPIDEISAVTGLTPNDIRRRMMVERSASCAL